MTIEERAIEIFENYPNPYEMPDDNCAYFDGEQVCDMMVKIATDQRQIDLRVVELVLYNAVEIGDVSCKDVRKLIESIKVAMGNLNV